MEVLSNDYPMVKPDYNCHNTYLLAIIESTNRGYINRTDGARICQNYLEQMLTSSNESSRPDIWTFNMVLNAWSKSNARDMVERAESILSLLESYHNIYLNFTSFDYFQFFSIQRFKAGSSGVMDLKHS